MNNYGLPWLEQAILHSFISTGAYQRHLRMIRKASSDTIGFLISRLQRVLRTTRYLGCQRRKCM